MKTRIFKWNWLLQQWVFFVYKTNIDIQCIPWVPIATSQVISGGKLHSTCINVLVHFLQRVFCSLLFNSLWDLLSLRGLVIYISQRLLSIYFCLGFSCCPYYRGVRYSEVSARRELTVFSVIFSPTCNSKTEKSNESNESNESKTNRDRFLDI